MNEEVMVQAISALCERLVHVEGATREQIRDVLETILGCMDADDESGRKESERWPFVPAAGSAQEPLHDN